MTHSVIASSSSPIERACAARPLDVSAVDSTGHHPQARIWFLLSAAASALCYFSGLGAIIAGVITTDRDLRPILVILGYAVLLLGVLLFYVKIGLALYWLHGAWKWVPIAERFGKDGKRYNTGDVFMLLIPYYHWYWMFPVNLGLCDAMERMRQHTNGGNVAKRNIAMWAAITELIPFGNFFVAPFLWASYMKSIDDMHDEIIGALAARQSGSLV